MKPEEFYKLIVGRLAAFKFHKVDHSRMTGSNAGKTYAQAVRSLSYTVEFEGEYYAVHLTIEHILDKETDERVSEKPNGVLRGLRVRNLKPKSSYTEEATLKHTNEEGGEFYLKLPNKRTKQAAFLDKHHELGEPLRIEDGKVWLGRLDSPILLKNYFTFIKVRSASNQISKNPNRSGSEPIPNDPPTEHTRNAMNTILYGPPGTGKTYSTIRRAVQIADGKSPKDPAKARERFHKLREERRIGFVTFHQSYSYEDFVEGIRPVLNTEDGDATPRYECRAGIFKEISTRAAAEPHKAFVLVIDEINRGNISKIFGELITLIEHDKRIGGENELPVTLPYSGDCFGVPPNLHILGTMNTADKSIALVDLALRRRFEFEELQPDFGVCSDLSASMRDCLNELNRRIVLRKDRDHRIGHAYFIRVQDETGFNSVFERKIIPLLQEYFYNDWDGLRFVLGEDGDSGSFIKKIEGSDERGTRTKWAWYTDSGDKLTGGCLAALGSNYGIG